MLQVKVLRRLVVVIAIVVRSRDLSTDRDFWSGCYRSILLQRVAVGAVVPVTFCTQTVGHEVGIVALLASRVERRFYAHYQRRLLWLLRGDGIVHKQWYRMVAEDKGLRVEESFAYVQTVELFAMVAVSRETSTSTDGCDSCSGCKE